MKRTTTFVTQLCVGFILLFLGMCLFYTYSPDNTILALDKEINMLSIKTLDNDIKRADQDKECLRSIIQWDDYLYYK